MGRRSLLETKPAKGHSSGISEDRVFAVVVDNDPSILMNACTIIGDAGMTALDGTTVAEAIAHFEDHDSEVVLLFTDLQMPGGRAGVELAREVAEPWPSTTILGASGNCKPGPGELPDGGRFLGKPFSASLVHDLARGAYPDGAPRGTIDCEPRHRCCHRLAVTPRPTILFLRRELVDTASSPAGDAKRPSRVYA